MSNPPAGEGALLLVVSGPSGVGKDSLLERLRERDLPFHFTVTATTRPQREVDPADAPFYTFVSEEEFDRLLAEDGLLEHATVYGYRYGVPRAQVRDALARGQDVVMRVDVQGAATIKRLVPQAVLVFIAPSSFQELEQRLRARAQDDDATIRRRLEAAAQEMAQQPAFDYTIVNEQDHLDDTADRLLQIIATERRSAGRVPAKV